MQSHGPGDVWLINMQGKFVHHWRMPYPPGAFGKLLPSGNLLYLCRIPGGPLDDFGGSATKLIEVDWNANIVWEYDDVYICGPWVKSSDLRQVAKRVHVPTWTFRGKWEQKEARCLLDMAYFETLDMPQLYDFPLPFQFKERMFHLIGQKKSIDFKEVTLPLI